MWNKYKGIGKNKDLHYYSQFLVLMLIIATNIDLLLGNNNISIIGSISGLVLIEKKLM
jgi:hypothetical protein